jgi:predicted small lipoprotein YifL
MRRHVVVLAALAIALAACGPKGPAAKTGDETRSAAGELRSGVTADDKVSKPDDPVDWKRFEVDARSPATVNIYWDDPSVEAVVTLRDMFGGPVAEVTHAKDAPQDTLGPVTLAEGTWFLQIVCTGGASVYTVEVTVGSADAYGVPRPE